MSYAAFKHLQRLVFWFLRLLSSTTCASATRASRSVSSQRWRANVTKTRSPAFGTFPTCVAVPPPRSFCWVRLFVCKIYFCRLFLIFCYLLPAGELIMFLSTHFLPRCFHNCNIFCLLQSGHPVRSFKLSRKKFSRWDQIVHNSQSFYVVTVTYAILCMNVHGHKYLGLHEFTVL